jgi:hypothetical protein
MFHHHRGAVHISEAPLSRVRRSSSPQILLPAGLIIIMITGTVAESNTHEVLRYNSCYSTGQFEGTAGV